MRKLESEKALNLSFFIQDDDYEEGLSDEEEELVRGLARHLGENLEGDEDSSNAAANTESRATTPIVQPE